MMFLRLNGIDSIDGLNDDCSKQCFFQPREETMSLTKEEDSLLRSYINYKIDLSEDS